MILDSGYQFGLGAFETISIYKNKPLFLTEHLNRLNKALTFLNINKVITIDDIKPYLNHKTDINFALKIMVSDENTIVTTRDIPYTKQNYINGFNIEISEIKRNNTSPFVFHKTLNYGDNIIEKRRANEINVDEILFLNNNDEIAECTTSNIFFIKDNQIFTPKISCGILAGTIRNYLCNLYNIKEEIIYLEDIKNFDECFVTNSLIGIMPVNRLSTKTFTNRTMTTKILNNYFENIFVDYHPIN